MHHFTQASAKLLLPYKALHAKARQALTFPAGQTRPSVAEQAIAQPQPLKRLEKELARATVLGKTTDQQKIYLCRCRANSSVLKELGRLRELTFRAVGEGTQHASDVDQFDEFYRHIVLWDEQHREIVGAYRLGQASNTPRPANKRSLYTETLFEYGEQFEEIFPYALELGRSFIQPKYWSKRGLDYLWQGIGAYLKTQPQVRYLFGGISISQSYPDIAKQHIAAYHQHYFQKTSPNWTAEAKLPFRANRAVLESYRDKPLREGTLALKDALQTQGVRLPTLYKHYVNLCQPEGIQFIAFNIDPDFSFCVDGLILLDLAQLKASKRQRYLR